MWQPAPEHSGDVRRLRYYLERARRNVSHFQLLICVYADSAYRDRLLTYLDELGDTAARVDLSGESEFTPTERIVAAAQGQQCLHVTGIDSLLRTDAQRWLGSINLQRETLARRCNNTLLLWWPSSAIVRLSTDAPDFWAWRSTEFDFHALPLPERPDVVTFDISFSARNNRELTDKQRRRRSIEDYLQRVEGTEEEEARLTASLTLELAEISFALGELDRAATEAQRALELYRSVGNRLGAAQAQSQIADILEVRGEFDAALLIREQEELPVYTQLDDVRSLAVAKGRIADVLAARGDFDAALSIREQEQLPVYVKLGDSRSLAATQGKIADILQARGDLDAALRIREQEELPVFTELGAKLSKLIAQTNIALLLLERRADGDLARAHTLLDEALAAARAMRVPEAEQIAEIIRKYNLEQRQDSAASQGRL